MYKIIKFSVVGPRNNRPVQFDDTCYFLACNSARQAALLSTLLNHPLYLEFLNSIVFWDTKRPITKKVLQRVNLRVLLEHMERQSLIEQANALLGCVTSSEAELSMEWPCDLEDLLNDFSEADKVVDSVQPGKKGEIIQGGLF